MSPLYTLALGLFSLFLLGGIYFFGPLVWLSLKLGFAVFAFCFGYAKKALLDARQNSKNPNWIYSGRWLRRYDGETYKATKSEDPETCQGCDFSFYVNQHRKRCKLAHETDFHRRPHCIPTSENGSFNLIWKKVK